jgi:hypothetical protein
MVRSGAPKRLWDDCLVREAYVRSSTALDIFSLEVQVPIIVVKGQTSEISPLTEYACYEWVKSETLVKVSKTHKNVLAGTSGLKLTLDLRCRARF